MPKVHVLPDIIANKIAAGEVVERPASVVKELMENAVDAGSSAIIVEVDDGGKRLVRVSDNGEGMGRDDALLAIERHATSKIQKMEDIENIVTLGFRGEALPSIVSVSHAIIETRRREDLFGTRLIIDGGVLKNVTDSARDPGTDVEIRNLFFNLPARRKFLGATETELRHVKTIVYDYIVASPGLSLTLIADGREIITYRGSRDRRDMLTNIFGASTAALMVPVEVEADGVHMSGFAGKPETARASGANQFIVLNGRPIRSKSIVRAVLDGYGPMLVRGSFPPFVLYVETDPSRVDVNVHPTKREVRIHREFAMMQALKEGIADAVQTLAAAPDLREPSPVFGKPRDPIATPVTVYNPPAEYRQPEISRTPGAAPVSAGNAFPGSDGRGAQIGLDLPLSENEMPSLAGAAGGSVEYGKDAAPFEGPAFWQLKDRYIITTIREGAIIIDQHVAHERILYEEVLAHFSGKQAPAQQLLFPITLDFSNTDFDILKPMIPFLNKIGFGVREFGERSIIVDAIPAGMARFEDGKIFWEFIEEMHIHGKITSGYIDKLAAAIACRAAVKAGKPLTQQEMQYLVDRLFATGSPFVCPHGRPTVVKLTLDELDRRFGR
jgi:DNA mismatch repair protein MutL